VQTANVNVLRAKTAFASAHAAKMATARARRTAPTVTAAKWLVGLAMLTLSGLSIAQDIPEPIPAKDLPKVAECIKCKSGEEPVHAAFKFKGKNYYFCNAEEVKEFLENPDKFTGQDDSPVKVPT
jgi:YHS domain-containing protein